MMRRNARTIYRNTKPVSVSNATANATTKTLKVPDPAENLVVSPAPPIEKQFVRYDEGAERYSMGKTSFIAMATEARAIYKRGKLCLVNVKIFEEYLETFRV